MASFNQHLSGGFIVGFISAISAFFAFSLSLVQGIVILIFTAFGSILPDIDSDTGRPVRIIFNTTAIILPVVTYQYFFKGAYQTEYLLCYMLAGYFIIRYPVSAIFRKYTVHRGIMHSLPFAVICGEITYLIFTGSPAISRIMFPIACIIGVLTHLIMDEFWSIDIKQIKIKKSLGSAFTLKSGSFFVTFLSYFIVIILALVIFLI